MLLSAKQNKAEKKPLFYRLLYRLVWLFSPKYELTGTENLPEDPCVIVGNHCQMYGPIAAELYMPRPHYTWCIGEMMNRKEVPAYAFQDFWSAKPRSVRWFYRILSYVIAPLASFVLSNAHTIAVYRDARVVSTFRNTISRLQQGSDVMIFPETAEPCNIIVCRFQEHFADLGRLYYRKTGASLSFVPMYVAPSLKSIHFGEPLRYDPGADDAAERTRVCAGMMESVTAMAESLPQHTVVPYLNIPRSRYPLNTDRPPANSRST